MQKPRDPTIKIALGYPNRWKTTRQNIPTRLHSTKKFCVETKFFGEFLLSKIKDVTHEQAWGSHLELGFGTVEKVVFAQIQDVLFPQSALNASLQYGLGILFILCCVILGLILVKEE